MARQEGIIKFTGRMGDISFYKSRDGYLAREKGGVDATRIKTDPAYQRTRENGAEFGRAGAAGKLLRTALRPLVRNVSDSAMSNRLMATMMKVIRADTTNARGERAVSAGDISLLSGFEFNEQGKLTTTVLAPYTTQVDTATGQSTISIEAFVPANMIIAPAGATHFQFITGSATVDFATGVYEVDTAESERFALSADTLEAQVLQTQVTPVSGRPIFQALGIAFYQEVNGLPYVLNNGAYNALAFVALEDVA